MREAQHVAAIMLDSDTIQQSLIVIVAQKPVPEVMGQGLLQVGGLLLELGLGQLVCWCRQRVAKPWCNRSVNQALKIGRPVCEFVAAGFVGCTRRVKYLSRRRTLNTSRADREGSLRSSSKQQNHTDTSQVNEIYFCPTQVELNSHSVTEMLIPHLI